MPAPYSSPWNSTVRLGLGWRSSWRMTWNTALAGLGGLRNADSLLTFVPRHRSPRAEEHGAQHRTPEREEGGYEERCVVAADERDEGAVAGSEQRVRAGSGKAGQDRQAERAAHHERGVDDPGREPGFVRLDVAHGGQEHRVERHSGAEAEQDHA